MKNFKLALRTIHPSRLDLFFSCFISLIVLGMVQGFSWSDEHVGTLTQLEGQVQLFTHPSKTLHQENLDPEKTRALFEGEYYLVQNAKVTDHVANGNILRTAPQAKVKIIFHNGDQFQVGSGTAYRVNWNSEKAKSQIDLNLMYGKMRGTVEKGGPRGKLRIKTRSVTMGVRGTDFFIAEDAQTGSTEISVLRGSVEITETKPEAKTLEVSKGFSAIIAAEIQQKLEIRVTSKEDIKEIKESTTLTQPVKITERELPKPLKLIVELEKKALSNTMRDIQVYDPVLFAKIDAEKPKSLEAVDQLAIQNLIQAAPSIPTRKRPTRMDLEDLEDKTYQKYFKKVE